MVGLAVKRSPALTSGRADDRKSHVAGHARAKRAGQCREGHALQANAGQSILVGATIDRLPRPVGRLVGGVIPISEEKCLGRCPRPQLPRPIARARDGIEARCAGAVKLPRVSPRRLQCQAIAGSTHVQGVESIWVAMSWRRQGAPRSPKAWAFKAGVDVRGTSLQRYVQDFQNRTGFAVHCLQQCLRPHKRRIPGWLCRYACLRLFAGIRGTPCRVGCDAPDTQRRNQQEDAYAMSSVEMVHHGCPQLKPCSAAARPGRS